MDNSYFSLSGNDRSNVDIEPCEAAVSNCVSRVGIVELLVRRHRLALTTEKLSMQA